VTQVPPQLLWISIGMAIAVAALYGLMLRQFTHAYAPFVDSLVLTLSVVAQLLLTTRRYETWWFWLGVNSLSIALFSFRGLWVTAALYSAFWINAWLAQLRWRRMVAN
jgi:nicotinamide mononucleotide transporter